MTVYCLVLTGRLLDGQDSAGVQARMAVAFGMEGTDFRQRVFERAPLLIRRGLDEATAQAQATQLEQMGVEAHVIPDDAPLIWLLREGQLRGPLPESALPRYAHPGDQWCHDGGQQWFPWEAASATHDATLPPPLPTAAAATPPPLPQTSRAAVSRWAIAAVCLAVLALLWHALAPIALLLGLGILLWLLRHPTVGGRGWAVTSLLIGAVALTLWLHQPTATAPATLAQQPYVPRPLQPLHTEQTEDTTAVRADTTQCPAAAPTPRNDEDRFLLTGGQRQLTGRAQRKGDTYVAEAASGYDGTCHPDNLQLYVFRHGVFIGTALENAVNQASTHLNDFELSDDQHLRISLAACHEKGGDCGTPSIRQIEVLHDAGGWIIKRAALPTP